MKKTRTFKMVFSALFAAVIFVGTQFIRVPLPFGYFNFGDCFVLLAAVMIPNPYSVAAAAVGSVLADILSGYTIYAPATGIIKWLMVVVVVAICKNSYGKGEKTRYIMTVIGAVCAEFIMICGYFLYDTFLYGIAGAVASVFGNIVQGVVAIIIGVLMIVLFQRSGIMKYINNRV